MTTTNFQIARTVFSKSKNDTIAYLLYFDCFKIVYLNALLKFD